MVEVSVVMPTYNSEEHIGEAIKSVLNQTFSDWELIIVNDDSTDSTLKIAKEFEKKDKKIRVISHRKNKGRAAALNTGINKAKGKYISFLDADDIYFKNKLERQVKFLEKNKQIDMIYGRARYFGDVEGESKVLDSTKVNLRRKLVEAKAKLETGQKVHKIFGVKGIIASCSVMLRRKVFKKCKFDENLRNSEDYDFWFQVIGKGFKIKNLNKNFYYYRVHKKGKSRNKKNMLIAGEYIKEKLKKGKYFD